MQAYGLGPCDGRKVLLPQGMGAGREAQPAYCTRREAGASGRLAAKGTTELLAQEILPNAGPVEMLGSVQQFPVLEDYLRHQRRSETDSNQIKGARHLICGCRLPQASQAYVLVGSQQGSWEQVPVSAADCA